MKDKRERYLIFGIVFLVALVFAYLLTNLVINGYVTVGSNEWDVHFDNVVVDSGSVSTDDGAAIDEDDDTIVNFSVNLDQPRDYYKFDVDIVNEGTINAMIDSIDLPEIESELLEFNATYQDGTEISDNDLLASGETQTITVVVNYKDDIDASDLDSENDDELEFSYGIDYVQADENANEVFTPSIDFATDSWKTIAKAVRDNDTDNYSVGDTKCVALNGITTTNNNGCENGEFKVRITNMSTPNECSTDGFSQTACGFVVEFVDLVSKYYMNPAGEHEGISYDYGWNTGGWPNTAMYTYLNSNIYSILPNDLKNNIIDTYTVSGYGNDGESNFISTNKIYIPSYGEIFDDLTHNDTAENKSRKFDYYDDYDVQVSGEAKYYNGTTIWWWLRTPSHDNYGDSFHYIENLTTCGNWLASASLGVAPFFRVG